MASRGGARPNTGGTRPGAGRPRSVPLPLDESAAILAGMRGADSWAGLARRLGLTSATAVHTALRVGLTVTQAEAWRRRLAGDGAVIRG